MKDAYIAVSSGQGRLLYALARAARARNVVELGTSFGISAIYLGAAARDCGGRVVTTEIEPGKIAAATRNIAEAGLSNVVTILGPRLAPGATIVMDNASFPGAGAFLQELRASRAFVTSLIESDKGAMEVGTYTGPWEALS